MIVSQIKAHGKICLLFLILSSYVFFILGGCVMSDRGTQTKAEMIKHVEEKYGVSGIVAVLAPVHSLKSSPR
jgi:hypothetical protein